MKKDRFEMFGFMTILAIAVCVMALIQLTDIDAVALWASTPWLSEHSKLLRWVALGIVSVTAIFIPPILMYRDVADAGDRLSSVGKISWLIARQLWVMFFMACIFWLIFT